jgi:tetratricopeptide (TPR) repeat protein
MKKLVILLILFTVLATSCSEEFLELTPNTSVTSGDFYKNEAHFNEAVIDAYAKLRGAFNGDHSWAFGESKSDNTHLTSNPFNRPASAVEREQIDQFLETSTFGQVAAKYNSLYNVISAVNYILTKIPEAGLEADVADPIIGQAKFIRALCYFDLVRYFGAVPLHDKAVETADEAFLQRSPVDDVYALILSDAEDAVAKLAVPTFPQVGFASKSSAAMLLGHVQLTLKNYSAALPHFEAITTYGHDLLPTYASVYELVTKNSIESILELQYLKTPGEGQYNTKPWKFLPLTTSLNPIVGFDPSDNQQSGGNNVPTGEMIASYEAGDSRLEASIGIAEGTGIAPDFVIESVQSPVGYTTPEGKVSYPFIKKYVHAHDVAAQTEENSPIYRYAETLLFMAETLNELSRGAEALSYLNQVRNRAGLPNVTETGQTALRDIIAHERRIELAFENKRWLDLVRTDKAIEVMTENGNYIKANYDVDGYFLPGAYELNQDKLILPIPEREITIGKLEQNPGY